MIEKVLYTASKKEWGKKKGMKEEEGRTSFANMTEYKLVVFCCCMWGEGSFL